MGVSVTQYWLKHYCPKGLCAICGNWGIIDTRQTAITPAGVNVGELTYCICPNGMALRKAKADPEQWRRK